MKINILDKFRRGITTLLAISMIAIPVGASEVTTIKPTDGDTYKAEGESKLQLGIGYYNEEGEFVPGGAIVSAVVPLLIPCSINPNEEYSKAFVSPEYKIKNTCQAPIKVKVQMKTGESAIPIVKSDRTPEEWTKLNKTKSSEEIALGMKEKSGDVDFWFEPSKDESIGKIDPLSDRTFSLKANHGMAFAEGKTLDYKIVYTIELE